MRNVCTGLDLSKDIQLRDITYIQPRSGIRCHDTGRSADQRSDVCARHMGMPFFYAFKSGKGVVCQNRANSG